MSILMQCVSVPQRLGVHFDIYSGESCHQQQAQEVVQQLQRRGLLKTTEYVMEANILMSYERALCKNSG